MAGRYPVQTGFLVAVAFTYVVVTCASTASAPTEVTTTARTDRNCADSGGGGQNCDVTCPEHCIDCTSEICTSCEDGFYGNSCNNSCPINCQNCLSESNCLSCKDGFYGPMCGSTCLKNCTRCTDGTTCIGCKDGTFGTNCSGECNVECFSCVSKIDCNFHCKPRSWGRACLNDCPRNCQTCTNNTSCQECRTGKLSANDITTCGCEETRCTNRTASGFCFGCNDTSWYATSTGCCQCGANCVNRNCNYLGHCTEGCLAGYYGDRCKLLCSSRDANCTLCQGSDAESFTCINCNDGMYPDIGTSMCVPCGDTCVQSTTAAPKCDASSGHCLYGCQGNYLGTRCQLQCNETCADCTVTDDRAVCVQCRNNFYLNPSDNTTCLPCNEHCLSGAPEPKCDRLSGNCSNGCDNGYFGAKCDNQCSPTCIGQTCDAQSGACSMGCQLGYGGPTCNVSCSQHCTGSTCLENRTCDQGCNDGWYGITCDNRCADSCLQDTCDGNTGVCTQGCKEPKYGDFCQEPCNKNCLEGTCYSNNGTCHKGCKTGYSGDKCDTQPPEKVAQAFAIEWIIIIVVGVAVLGVVGSVVIIIITRKRKGKLGNRLSKMLVMRPKEERGLYKANINNRNTELIIVNPTFGEKGLLSEPGDPDWGSLAEDDREMVSARKVPVSCLLTVLKAKGGDDFAAEFDELPVGLTKPHIEASKKENLTKTIYADVLPYDESRVVLKRNESSFINASYIQGFSKPKWYIAAQAPNKNTIKDFWFMAWQEKVSTIVMMTRFTEEELSDGDKYWPELGASIVQGEITITGRSEQENSIFITRVFSVQRGGETRRLTQLEYLDWHSSGVPNTVIELAQFHAKYRNTRMEAKDADHGVPAIVHCSAGVGRTGVFIALDLLYDEAMATKIVSIPDTVKSLREQRVSMVQDIGQYVWLHKVLAQCLLMDCRPVEQSNFLARYTKLSMTLDEDVSLLERNYMSVANTLILDDRDLESMKRNAEVTKLNRPTADKVDDLYRPVLSIDNLRTDSDYINAVYINGYTGKNRFIMTQFPTPDTINDFYRMVEQTHCSCIVLMEGIDTKDKTQVQFLPKKSSSKTYGKIVINSQEVEYRSNFDILHLTLFKKERLSTIRGVKEREVAVYQFKAWDTANDLPTEEAAILELVHAVKTHEKATRKPGPVIVTCLNGSNRSGIFVMASIVLESMETSQEVSMAASLRQIQARRPGAIPNLEQYRFCHEIVLRYMSSIPSPEDLQPYMETVE